MTKLTRQLSMIKEAGWLVWLNYRWHYASQKWFSYGHIRTIRVPGDLKTVYYRSRTSDLVVFWQVFVSRYYDIECELPETPMILDGGANVGYTTRYYLLRYPNARIVSVQPDPGNLKLLKQNVSEYGGRVDVVPAALAASTGSVHMTAFGSEGQEFARRFAQSERASCEGVPAITLSEIASENGVTGFSLIKLDIEGAESDVLRSGDEAFWANAALVVVELHGPEAHASFADRFDRSQWEISSRFDLTIAKTRSALKHA